MDQFTDTLVLTLRRSIDLGGLVFESVTLVEPTGLQLQKASKAGVEPYGELFTLIAETAEVPIGVPQRMLQRDLERAADFFGHFSPSPTAANSATSPPK